MAARPLESPRSPSTTRPTADRWRLFSTVTPADPSATFTGQAGNTYAFLSIATDNAGNVQPTPTAAQQTVEILSPMTVSSIAAVAPNPRNAIVSSLDITFSVPINTSSLTAGALTFTDNGQSISTAAPRSPWYRATLTSSMGSLP